MANASPDDQMRAQRSDDPALAVASKRIVSLEADILNLRKGMVQQLTVSGKLIKAVFALDEDYFGGRFQEQQDKDNPDPFRDFTVATKIVEAISEEVQGASAFADSPVLRDGIANLITALESARGICSDMEKAGIEAVGMPIKAEVFKTRVFPDDNALACLAESAGTVHDLSNMMGRTRDRFSAMQMMLNEAERARAEAESSVTPVNIDKVIGSVTEELKSVQQELKTTRVQLMSTIDSHAHTMKELKLEVERARREATNEADSRRADHAETRSLAAEIARQIEISMPDGGSDDLDITLSVLREALGEEQDIASLAAATESLVVDWIRLTSEQLARAKAKAATPVAAVASGPDPKIAALEKELANAKSASAAASAASAGTAAETAALKTKLAEAEKRATTNEQTVAALKAAAGTQSNDQQAAAAKLNELQLTITARDNEAKKQADQIKADKAQLEQVNATVVKLTSELEAAKTQAQSASKTSAEVETLRAKLKQTEEALLAREAAVKAADEQITSNKAKVTQLQSQLDSQKVLLENNSKTAQQGAESVNRDIAALRTQLSQATTAVRSKEDEAKRAREALQQEQSKHADVFQNLTRQLHGAQEKLAVTTSELQNAKAQLNDLSRTANESSSRLTQEREVELKHLRETHAKELKTVTEARVEAEAARGQLSATLKQAETSRTQEQNDTRKTISTLEQRITEVQGKMETANTEIARLKGELGRVSAEHTKAAANVEFASARERQLGIDRERLERERSELQARLDALRKTNDATVNQSEQTLGGLKKQLSETQAVEQEVRSQLDKLAKESKALGERAALTEQELSTLRSERDKLTVATKQSAQERDQARLKLSEMERERAKLTESQARAEAISRTASTDLVQLKRSEAEAVARAEKLTVELAQVRERLTTAQGASAQAVAQQNSLKTQEAQLVQERDTAKAAITSLTAERDRLQAQSERLTNDNVSLTKQLSEREAQLTTRLNDAVRQVGELKQSNERLAADSERVQAEAKRMAQADIARDGAKEALERKESTSVWTKRLSDSAADAEKARTRAAELERKIDEQRHQLAQFEERLARQTQSDIHLRERISVVERRETTLQSQLTATKSEADQARTRLAALEKDLATARAEASTAIARQERQKVKFEALMREAREAVMAAKVRQEQTDSDDKEIIAGLNKQIQELRLRTSTNL